MGVIASIKVLENKGSDQENVYTKPSGYKQYSKQSKSYRLTSYGASKMRAAIKKQQSKIEKIKALYKNDSNHSRVMEMLPRYQFRGKSHSFGKTDEGVNCMEWCVTMLNVGLEADKQNSVAMSPKPPKPSCCIL